MSRSGYSCLSYESPFHSMDDCPEFVQKVEEKRRQLEMLARNEYEDFVDTLASYGYYNPPPPDYQRYYDWQDWNDNYCEPQMAPRSNCQEEYNDYHNEYPHPAYEKQYNQGQIPYSTPENAIPQEVDPINQSMEEKIATCEWILSETDDLLSKFNISDQERIRYLTAKCQALSLKIRLEEYLSPLSYEIMNYSQVEEEVVENNTTSTIPLFDEEQMVEQILIGDGGAGEVIDLPKEVNESFNQHEDIPLEQSEMIKVCGPSHVSINPTNKVPKGSKIKIRKVGPQDLGQFIMKWTHIIFFYLNMLLIVNHIWIWHVEYRAYIGNSVGKCALRPP